MQKPFKTTLSNGLRVILLENHAAPVVSWNLWCNVGSADETDAEAGICHLIEHMLFKGTGRRAVGEIAKEVEAAGGDMNAYTSFDETVFYINMSSRRLEVGLDILADAACDPTFDLEELTREKEVVVEEISRAEDNPSQMVGQDLFAKIFTTHTYGRPIAGSRETVRAISREHLMSFFRKWYVGSNLIFIGAGDFKIADVLPKIEALYSKIPAGQPPRLTLPTEPKQESRRIITRGMPVEGRYFELGIPAPSLTHPDIPVLNLLSDILGGGAGSRLEQTVRLKKSLVTGIGSYPYTPRHPGALIISGVLREKALKETLCAVWQEVEHLQKEIPSTVEFTRARENLRSARVYGRQTVEAMARKLGYYEGLAENLDFEDEYYRRLSEATPEDVLNAARTYLDPEKLTLAFCHPQRETWAVSDLGHWLDQAVRPSPPAKSSPKLSAKKSDGIVTFRLPSGVRLIVRENHALPLISIRSASLGGLRSETKKNNGISHLVSSLLTQGTHHRSAREIAEETEKLSGHIHGYMGRNILGVSGTFLSEHVVEGLNLFFDVLLNPSFPEEEILKEKAQTLTAIRNEEDSLSTVAIRKFLAALYPNHPYGLPGMGTAESLKRLKRADLLQHHRRYLTPDNLVIAVCGDVDAEDLKERVQAKLSGLKKAKIPAVKLSKVKEPSRPIEILTRRKKLQAHIVYGFLGTTLQHKDRHALEVLNNVLAGQGGRLFLELRDKQGLAYSVSSGTNEGIEPGYVNVYMGTDPAKRETALEGIKLELAKIRENLISEEELERSKRFIIGNYELDLQKNSTIASLMAYQEIYGLGAREFLRYATDIERVTRQDVLRVAKKYLRPEASILSIVTS